MSQEFSKSYTGFSREILSEFMTPKELRELDAKYNEAKFVRMLKSKQLFEVLKDSPFVDKNRLVELMLKELEIKPIKKILK